MMPFPLPTDPLGRADSSDPDVALRRLRVGDDELGRCRAVIDALPARRFARGLELGCRTGVLTRYLASNCDTLLALDQDEAALSLAELRCEDQPWVQFAAIDAEGGWSDGDFNLIVVDELLHRLDAAGRRLLAARALAALGPGGTIILVTRRRALDMEAAADRFVGDCRPRLLLAARLGDAAVRIDVLT